MSWILNDPPPNKALELAKCQRYFVSHHSTSVQNTSVFIGVGVLDGIEASGNTSGQGFIILPCNMRATPTISGSLNVYNSIVNAAISNITVWGVSGNVVRINFIIRGAVSLEERMCVLWSAGDFYITADL